MLTEKKSVKNKIKGATARLLGEKSYLDITVTDIVNSAEIARVSFYRNYRSTADVFDDIVEDIFSEISKEIIPILKCNDEQRWRKLLDNMFRRFPQHHSIGIDKKPENVTELFSRMTEKLQTIQDFNKSESVFEKYICFGKIGLIVNIIKKWMADGQTESPEEMVDYIMTFITKF